MSDSKPIEFVKPKSNRLRPLFTGRIANALDSIANGASTVLAIFVVVGGLSVFGYHLANIAITLASHGAWFSLFGIALFVLAFAVCFKFSSMVTRMVLVFILAGLSLFLAPTLEQPFL